MCVYFFIVLVCYTDLLYILGYVCVFISVLVCMCFYLIFVLVCCIVLLYILKYVTFSNSDTVSIKVCRNFSMPIFVFSCMLQWVDFINCFIQSCVGQMMTALEGCACNRFVCGSVCLQK